MRNIYINILFEIKSDFLSNWSPMTSQNFVCEGMNVKFYFKKRSWRLDNSLESTWTYISIWMHKLLIFNREYDQFIQMQYFFKKKTNVNVT